MGEEQEPIIWRTWQELVAWYPTPEQANDEYNRQVAAWADYEPNEPGATSSGKRVSYIGWFWRDVDFAGLSIPIGRINDDMTGVMASNKWGYDSRHLTRDEALYFRDLLDTAFVALRDDDRREAKRVTRKLWSWMYRLKDVGSWYIEETWQQWQARHAGV